MSCLHDSGNIASLCQLLMLACLDVNLDYFRDLSYSGMHTTCRMYMYACVIKCVRVCNAVML